MEKRTAECDTINQSLRDRVTCAVAIETREGIVRTGILTEIRWRQLIVGKGVRLLPESLVLGDDPSDAIPLVQIVAIR